MKQTIKLLSFAMALFMVSCSGGSDYYIDNPTSEPINVSVDGQAAVTVAANEFKKMDGGLKEGEHTMKVGEGAEVKFNTADGTYVLNPTGATYVKVKQEYGIGIASGADYVDIDIDGTKYNGPFPNVYTEPVIDIAGISYDVTTPFSDQVTVVRGQTKVVKTKIFRKDDFIKFYKEEFE